MSTKTETLKFAELCVANQLVATTDEVGRCCDPDDESVDRVSGVAGIEILLLVEIIAQVIATIIEQCGLDDDAIKKSLRTPNAWQRVKFRRVMKDHVDTADGGRWRDSWKTAADCCMSCAADECEQNEAAVNMVIQEARETNNWLI